MPQATRFGFDAMDFGQVAQTLIGAFAGGVGSWIAIRERLAIVETKHATAIEAIYKHIGAIEANAVRAHQRIDTIRGNH